MGAAKKQAPVLPALPEGHWIDEDGFEIDAQGEVLGFVGKPESFAMKEVFRPTTRDSVEWVLKKIGDCESKIDASERRLKVLKSNLEKQIKREKGRLEFLHMRFDADLIEFAKKDLEGRKGKTCQLDQGKIAFRTTNGTNKIRDMDRAVAWARKNGHENAVKVEESITVTAVMAIVGEGEIPPDVAVFLESTEPRESVTITADLNKKDKKEEQEE